MKLASIKQIKKISSASKRYDVEVENNHNFFTNNVLVHNSLGICFYHKNKWHLTTRGSLNSDIGEVGQRILDEYITNGGAVLFPDFTYLTELIFKENRIVVNYGDDRKLVLLGARYLNTGDIVMPDHIINKWPMWHTLPFDHARAHSFKNKQEMLTWLNQTKGTDFEGFVVHFSDGSIFKFKSEDYMRLHRIVAQFTFKRVLEAVQLHQEEEIRRALPEELIPEFDRYIEIINSKVKDIVARVALVVAGAPKESRKEFALYLQQYYKGTDVLKYAFKFVDLNMDGYKLMEHVLQSLRRDDFEVVENEKES